MPEITEKDSLGLCGRKGSQGINWSTGWKKADLHSSYLSFFTRKKKYPTYQTQHHGVQMRNADQIVKKLVREYPAALKGFNSHGLGRLFPGC